MGSTPASTTAWALGNAVPHRKGSRQAGISKDLRELWEEDHDERLDLVLVGCCLIAELGVQAYQFPVRRYPLAWHIAGPCLPAQKDSGNGHGVKPVRLGP